MKRKSIKELGRWFLLISVAITLLICIPLNIKYKNSFMDNFNISKTREINEYKEFKICPMWFNCNRGEIIGTKIVSNNAFAYLCMFLIELIFLFVLYLCLWMTLIKKIVLLSRKNTE